MKKIIFPAALIPLLFLSAFTFFTLDNLKIADNFSIKFSGNSASGGFTSLKGDILFDENNPTASRFDVTIAAATINTGNSLKNKHAKDENWLDVVKYPTIGFKSTKISKTGNGYETTGTLDLHGVQKQITFPFTFKDNTFAATFNIKRSDYNIGSTTGLDALIAADILIDVVVPVNKQIAK